MTHRLNGLTHKNALADGMPAGSRPPSIAKQKSVEPEMDSTLCLKGSPAMSSGRHPEPKFRVTSFQPFQVHSCGMLTTTAYSCGSMPRVLVQGVYGLGGHRRGISCCGCKAV